MPSINGRLVGREVLRRELAHMRAFLVPAWVQWGATQRKHVDDRGQGAAAATSVFLARALGRGWRLAGGNPDGFNHVTCEPELVPGGYENAGVWHEHAWVTDNELVVDLTASQHGGPDVVIARLGDLHYLETLSKPDVAVMTRALKPTADAWLRSWLSARALLALGAPSEPELLDET